MMSCWGTHEQDPMWVYPSICSVVFILCANFHAVVTIFTILIKVRANCPHYKNNFLKP